jgi:uncharacterized protein YdhG (YjbR/CyaY superfamily)
MADKFTPEERAAMRERAKELKREASRADGEADLLAKVAEMSEPDRAVATRLHAVITANAPGLAPRTWYGMPAYADAEGKVVLFFRDRQKFKERYFTLGFNEQARLDEGRLWPTAFALTDLTSAEEEQIAALVRKAVGG